MVKRAARREIVHERSECLSGLVKIHFLIASLDFGLIEKVAKTGRGLDLHDRVIAVTAKLHEAIVLSKDREIRKMKGIKTLW